MHLFDVHATFGRHHEERATCCRVDRHRDIELTRDICAAFDEHPFNREIAELGPQQSLGSFAGVGGVVALDDAATFASFPSWYLGLDHDRPADLAGSAIGRVGSCDDLAVWNGDTAGGDELFGIVFFDEHVSLLGPCGQGSRRRVLLRSARCSGSDGRGRCSSGSVCRSGSRMCRCRPRCQHP